jgi:hypothetical protein
MQRVWKSDKRECIIAIIINTTDKNHNFGTWMNVYGGFGNGGLSVEEGRGKGKDTEGWRGLKYAAHIHTYEDSIIVISFHLPWKITGPCNPQTWKASQGVSQQRVSQVEVSPRISFSKTGSNTEKWLKDRETLPAPHAGNGRKDLKWWLSICGLILSWDGGILVTWSLATLTIRQWFWVPRMGAVYYGKIWRCHLGPPKTQG